jgi:DNA helicase HerA-like ATPase
LATAADWEDPESFDEEEAYAILLRAEGPADLPNEKELMEVRAEAMRKKITEGTDEELQQVPASSEDVLDVLTRNEIQFSGINAKILGTLYEEDGEMKFGSDVDTFYSSAQYRVYKPGARALREIMSIQTEEDEEGVRIGRVRYSSTERDPVPNEARVPIDVRDVIGSKTAVFGMTRTGKSNTMKILATAIFEHAQKEDNDIGQILFDPAGEYANPNEQDEMALRELSDEHTTVYQWGGGRGGEINAESLKMNFYEEDNIEAVWGEIQNHVPTDAGYKKDFLEAGVIGPEEPSDNWSSHYRSKRRRSALYATLSRADFTVPDGFTSSVSTAESVKNFIEAQGGIEISWNNGTAYLNSGDELEEFWQVVADNIDELNQHYRDEENKDKDWVDTQLESILNVFNSKSGRGHRILQSARKFHDADESGFYAEEIYERLKEGQLVIVDMSTGTESSVKITSETIIRHIFNRAVDRFTSGETLHDIQIYLEEAHNHFNRDNLEEAPDRDPYVRLAKEASKYNIGLIYATQEVSSVDERVLANTANWVVTHLNNTNETRELSRYYNFEDFDRSIREAEDVGFARIKTKSGRFIVPTQVDEFDEKRIQAAQKHME